jgi:hypothetical protein
MRFQGYDLKYPVAAGNIRDLTDTRKALIDIMVNNHGPKEPVFNI